MIPQPKKRGEWAELQFLARAAAHGLTVSKPWGDSTPYDCVVESNRVFYRVQVKSTTNIRKSTYECPINCYVHAKRGTRYAPGDIDFYAIYLILEDLWYIIPAADVQGRTAVGLNPRNRKNPYLRYVEAWHLLTGARPLPDDRKTDVPGGRRGRARA